MSLIKPDGFVGLLTPSGIYADKTAARFFQSVSTNGRVSAVCSILRTRKFSSRTFTLLSNSALSSWAARSDDSIRPNAPFFLHDTKTVHDEDCCFPLSPDDFARVNPNTGTAPVFRSRKDAEITRRIYEQHPVLVDRSQGKEKRVWPVKYTTMFHMTNDSHLFRTAEQLDSEGFYPVEGNRWKKGKDLYLPLYEGKMVQAFDHRAASVVVNPENLSRTGQPREATPRGTRKSELAAQHQVFH